MREDSMHGNILHTHTCTQTLTHKYTLTCIHTLTNTHGLICTHAHALTDILPSIHTLRARKKNLTLTCMNYTGTHALTHTCIQIFTFTVYSHMCVHKHIHAHTLLLTNTVMLKSIQKQLVVITTREQSTVG